MKKLLGLSIIRYILAGGGSYAVEVLVLMILVHIFRVEPILSVAISFWFGFGVSFIVQKVIAFQDKDFNKKKVARQTFFYGTLVLVNYAFTLSFVYLFETIAGILAARTAALIITTTWNFIAYKHLIFKKSNKNTQ